MHFHLYAPNIFQFQGGIQNYSNLMLKSLQNIYPQSTYSVFLKHDVLPKPCTLSLDNYLPSTRWYFSGKSFFSVRTPVFTSQIIHRGLIERPRLAIATHLHFSVAANILKQLAGIPYWTIAYGIEAWNIQDPIVKAALFNADRIISISDYTRSRLIQQQIIPQEKIITLHGAVNTKRFQIRDKPAYLLKKYGLNPSQPIILTVNRLWKSEKYKGYDKIIQSLLKIRHVIPDIHYILVGKGDDYLKEGDDRPRIRDLIAKYQLQDCVTIADSVEDDELPDYYNLCDVFAMPSKKEGFGIVYVEALACGKPALGGNKDGTVDALSHGELGALIDPDDTEAIASTLIQILQGHHPNSLIYQPQLLRQKAIERFSVEHFQETLECYLKEYFQC